MDKKLDKEVSHIKNLIIYDRSKTLLEQVDNNNSNKFFEGVKLTYPDDCWDILRVGPYNYINDIKKSKTSNEVLNIVAKSIYQGVNDIIYQSSNWGKNDKYSDNRYVGTGGPSSENSLINMCKSYDSDNNCVLGANRKILFSSLAADNPDRIVDNLKKTKKYLLPNGEINWHMVVIDQIGTTNLCDLNEKVLSHLPRTQKPDYGEFLFPDKDTMDKIMDPHIWLPVASIAVGLLTGGIGGLLLSAAFEIADAALYLQQGDTETAALATIFLLIPGGMLLNRIPSVKNFTSKAINIFMGKVLNKLPLNATETKLLREIGEQQDELYRLAITYGKISEKMAVLMKLGLKGSVIGLLKLSLVLTRITKWTFRIGTVWWSFDSLLFRLTEYFNMNYENITGKSPPTLTEEQKSQNIDEIVNYSEEELNLKFKTEAENLSKEQEETLENINNVFKGFDINQYVKE